MLTILMTVCLMNCGSEPSDPNFQISSSGIFYTQDVERAQKEVAFNIVVPTYLPGNISDPPIISGPSKKLQAHSDLDMHQSELLMIYRAGALTEGFIEISEWGYTVGMSELIDVEYETLLIRGIEITQLRGYTRLYMPGDGSSVDPGYLFYWDQNGVSIHTAIYHYSYDEAVRVVESMIQQGE